VHLQAPDVLVNDATLENLVQLRPSSMGEMRLVSGMGAAALQHYGEVLLQVRTQGPGVGSPKSC
jgi:superfamily II DNA helicase RecQ